MKFGEWIWLYFVYHEREISHVGIRRESAKEASKQTNKKDDVYSFECLGGGGGALSGGEEGEGRVGLCAYFSVWPYVV